jgi:hypothetical protein
MKKCLIEKAMEGHKMRKENEKKKSIYNEHKEGEYKGLKVKKPKNEIL